MTNFREAAKICPDLILQHVATWKEGDDKWAYHPDAFANMSTHKVSLDPYRTQSRKILALIKEFLPANLQKVEKASIDEVFLDLSAQAHAVMLERYPELRCPPPNHDPSHPLPRPSVCALDWQSDCLVDLDDLHDEAQDPDWDDVALLIGSEIVRGVRSEIRKRLCYTCSAGIATNKMLSKLGSAQNKPNKQTVIRSRAVQHFLSGFKFTKIRMLGGKLGEKVAAEFDSDFVRDILPVSAEQLKLKLGDDTGIWIYNTIRGTDTSEVSPRTQIKSMLSAKAFRPDVTTLEQATKWLRIFAGDIFSRLVDEGVLENKRRPTTIGLHHTHASSSRSRQGRISQGKAISEDLIFELSKGLMREVLADGKVWPCSHLSLTVAGFEDCVSGNMCIGSFLVKGEAARTFRETTQSTTLNTVGLQAKKKRRTESGVILRFLAQQDEAFSSSTGESAASLVSGDETVEEDGDLGGVGMNTVSGTTSPAYGKVETPDQAQSGSCMCSRCSSAFDSREELRSHQDWHLAKDLQEEERVNSTFVRQPGPPRSSTQKWPGGPSKRARGKMLEQGQSLLRFG